MTIDIKYENYSVKDFLEDDLFLQWQLAPTETLDEFWTLFQIIRLIV